MLFIPTFPLTHKHIQPWLIAENNTDEKLMVIFNDKSWIIFLCAP